MKIVKTMTKSAWDYVGLKRFPEDDFTDDGNRFKMYIYKDFLKISYTTGDGEKYLAIRDDYGNYNDTSYEFFNKHFKEAADCTWDFNGVSEIDLDALKENLEKVYQALKEAPILYKKEVEAKRPELLKETFKQLMTGFNFNELALSEARKFNILDADFEKIYENRKNESNVCWSIKEFKKAYDDAKKDAEYYKNMIIRFNKNELSDQELMNGIFVRKYDATKILNTIKIANSLAA